ncbi:MAG: spermidine synthase, partial [Limisphaerales bacterium]
FQMGGTAARAAEERQAHIPLLLHAEAKRALFIGLGTGITFQAAANYPDLEADGVELVPEIAAAMSYFNEASERGSANLRTHIADGRRFVRAAEGKYDVIVSDLFHPAQDGAGFLYTVEHFAAIRERLASGGLFCQWLPVYQMDLGTLQIVMATFAQVFPKSEVWLLRFNIDVPVVGLVARLNEEKISSDLVERRLEQSTRLAEQLKRVGLNDSVRLMGCYVGKLKAAAAAEINTDLNPTLVFRAPALTFRKRNDPGERLLALMREMKSDPAVLLKDEGGFARRVGNFVEARDVYLRGLDQESNDFGAALNAYIESARISEDFTAGSAQALGIATGLARERPEQSRAILERLAEARPERPVARELLERLSVRSGEE